LQCGGGISHQFRRCLDIRCVGPSHRERICSSQVLQTLTQRLSTFNHLDLVLPRGASQCTKAAIYPRETQCSKLDGYVLLNGERRAERWIPVQSNQQCSVTCSSVETGRERELRKLSDGTSCIKEGYNVSVCLSGICQHVGCDGIIGSSARFDHCGVCEGNGSSCGRTAFKWKDTKQFSPCDATCGPNSYRVSVSVCHNVRTGRVVPERLCADQARPRPVVEKCPHIVCPSQ
uniref:ADAMTS/ADAMTS-like cysteine-rich domain-containing protein n=1 Tax=Ascaris lumbricoides TaxID=6252 RepID=A0A9J2PHX0_ASCLU